MQLSAFVALVISAVAANAAQPILFTQPLQGAKWTQGASEVIAWTEPTVPTLPALYLMKGPATALQQVKLLGSDIPTASGSMKVTVPCDVGTGDDYALQAGITPDVSYIGHFSIVAGKCTGGSSATGNSTKSTAKATASAVPSSVAPASSKAATSAPAASRVPSNSADLTVSGLPSATGLTSGSPNNGTVSTSGGSRIVGGALAIVAPLALLFSL